MYGRYEYKDDRSDKFWSIKKLKNGNVLAEWGRNGSPPQGTKEYTQSEARNKLYEKTAKGYRLKAAYEDHYKSEQEEATGRAAAKRAERVAESAAGSSFMEMLKKL